MSIQQGAIPVTRLPWPTDWSEQFGRTAPLVVEIGFGTADFLADLARRMPAANVLGIEISLPSLRKAERKCRSLDNVRLLQGGAELALQAAFAANSIDHLIINFPDPWPKARHQHRRLVNAPFLALAAARLPVGALLDIATDHPGYGDHILDCLLDTPYFESQLPVPFLTEADMRLHTKYERFGQAQGHTSRYFRWRRIDTAAPPLAPPQELPMPHVLVKSNYSLRDAAHAFVPWQASASGMSVRFIDAFIAPDGRLLVEANINEQPLAQRLALLLRLQEPGTVIMGLHEIGFPRPTPGVHFALHSLANWFVAQDPGASILRSNLKPPADQSG